MTAARYLWLNALYKGGPQSRPRGPVGYHCMQLRWTCWVYTDANGRWLTGEELRQELAADSTGNTVTFNELAERGWENTNLEYLTAAGLWQLHREQIRDGVGRSNF